MKILKAVFNLYLLLIGFVLVNGCTLSPSEKPIIKSIDVMLEDYTNAPYMNNGQIFTAFTWYFFYLENPDSYADIVSLEIVDPLNNKFNLGRNNLRWIDAEGCINTPLCHGIYNTHFVTSGQYSLKFTLADGSNTSTTFMVSGRSDLTNKGALYSEQSTMTPKILINPTNCSATRSGNNLTVNFTCNDSIITDAYVWFYDASDNYLGYSVRFSTLQTVKPTAANTYIIDVSTVPAFTKIRVVNETTYTVANVCTVCRSRSAFVNVIN